ncbi:hypothetical protein AV530_008618 [Patagioenas fasciata monilis]|uniref:Uncharacterized protein n=1 Tax=Patagioenas fasciata monilis TaxID=372326 RepID=A0A1V4L0Q6_PATFA|nr:hypothetical protein AV530_008618 [Patagioenas fasciata monilis]
MIEKQEISEYAVDLQKEVTNVAEKCTSVEGLNSPFLGLIEQKETPVCPFSSCIKWCRGLCRICYSSGNSCTNCQHLLLNSFLCWTLSDALLCLMWT